MSTTFTSPKRKRVEDRPATPKIQVTCPIPRFQPQVGDNGDPDVDGSPRTRVAGRFQRLDLDQQVDNFDLGLEEPENKRLATDASKAEVQHPLVSGPFANDCEHRSEVFPLQDSIASLSHDHRSLMPSDKQGNGRPKSPSLKGEISDQYWHESEITGHDPDDPNDDGEGINGIGFKPTPAIAWARAQKRKSQLADYRSREAKEARAKRTERRRMGSAELKLDDSSFEGEKKAKVRFSER